MEAYFLANEITDVKKKKAILVTVIGAKTYKLLRDLLIPKKPMEVIVDVILETLSKHYEPIPCEIVGLGLILVIGKITRKWLIILPN